MTDLQAHRDPIVVIFDAELGISGDYRPATEREYCDVQLPPGSYVRFLDEDHATLLQMVRMSWLARAFRHLTIVEPGVIAH